MVGSDGKRREIQKNHKEVRGKKAGWGEKGVLFKKAPACRKVRDVQKKSEKRK